MSSLPSSNNNERIGASNSSSGSSTTSSSDSTEMAQSLKLLLNRKNNVGVSKVVLRRVLASSIVITSMTCHLLDLSNRGHNIALDASNYLDNFARRACEGGFMKLVRVSSVGSSSSSSSGGGGGGGGGEFGSRGRGDDDNAVAVRKDTDTTFELLCSPFYLKKDLANGAMIYVEASVIMFRGNKLARIRVWMNPGYGGFFPQYDCDACVQRLVTVLHSVCWQEFKWDAMDVAKKASGSNDGSGSSTTDDKSRVVDTSIKVLRGIATLARHGRGVDSHIFVRDINIRVETLQYACRHADFYDVGGDVSDERLCLRGVLGGSRDEEGCFFLLCLLPPKTEENDDYSGTVAPARLFVVGGKATLKTCWEMLERSFDVVERHRRRDELWERMMMDTNTNTTASAENVAELQGLCAENVVNVAEQVDPQIRRLLAACQEFGGRGKRGGGATATRQRKGEKQDVVQAEAAPQGLVGVHIMTRDVCLFVRVEAEEPDSDAGNEGSEKGEAGGDARGGARGGRGRDDMCDERLSLIVMCRFESVLSNSNSNSSAGAGSELNDKARGAIEEWVAKTLGELWRDNVCTD